MAENKKSFILYCDQKGVWDKLDDAQAGRLIKHIISYVNDDNPVAPDFITELAFEPIKQSLKRDLKKWEKQQEQRSEAGKRSAEVRKLNAKLAKRDSTTVNDRSISSTVNGNVNVNDNVNVNESLIKTPTREEVEKEICNNLFTRGIASVSFPVEDLAQRFHDNYESKGWEINGQRIYKWQPKLNQWISEELKNKSSSLETQEEKEAREFMQMINDYNTHKTLYGEDSANSKFKFDVQPDINNNRIA